MYIPYSGLLLCKEITVSDEEEKKAFSIVHLVDGGQNRVFIFGVFRRGESKFFQKMLNIRVTLQCTGKDTADQDMGT